MIVFPVQRSSIKVRIIVRRHNSDVSHQASAATAVAGSGRIRLEINASLAESLLTIPVSATISWIIVETVECVESWISSMVSMMTMFCVMSSMICMMMIMLLFLSTTPSGLRRSPSCCC